MRLRTELTAGTDPKPPASIAMSLITTPTGWFGQLKIMASQAEHLPALRPSSSKNAFSAETLSCSAIAVENNRFMTSQHDFNFNSAHRLSPGLHFGSAVGSSVAHLKSWYYCITMKVSRDYISKLDTAQKNTIPVRKRRIVPKREVFVFFQSSMWGRKLTVDPRTAPPYPVRTLLTSQIDSCT